MIFSSKPALIAMERMMTQPPYYRPRGHGKCKPKKLPPDNSGSVSAMSATTKPVTASTATVRPDTRCTSWTESSWTSCT